MASISVKMDNALKMAFEAACEDMGMPMSVAFTIFVKRVARDRRIPFEITADPDPICCERNMSANKETDNGVEASPGIN